MSRMSIKWDSIAYIGKYKGLDVYTPIFDPRLYAGGGASFIFTFDGKKVDNPPLLNDPGLSRFVAKYESSIFADE